MSTTNRNQTADVLRGLAILLVILGHTMSNCGIDAFEDTFLYRVIWSLQMPLFMLISGFVSRYTKKPESFRDLLVYVRKRCVSYLLPWLVWTLAVNGLFRGFSTLAELPSYFIYMLFHMDSGFWFLGSLWTICILFICAFYLSAKMKQRQELWLFIFAGVGTVLLALVAYIVGLNFFALKLTLYYIPFFFLGRLLHNMQSAWGEKPWYITASQYCVLLSLILYAASLRVFNSYTAQDHPLQIAMRFFQSLTGCITVSAAVHAAVSRKLSRPLCALGSLGKKTMELYLSHYIFLNLVRTQTPLSLFTLAGWCHLIANFILAVGFSLLLSAILSCNRFSAFLFFGKSVRLENRK